MPINIKDVTLEYKILPICMNEDESSTITVRKGYMDDGVFKVIEGITVQVSILETSAILDVQTIPGLTRRNDLALAIYTWLVENNCIEAGTIS